MECLLQGFLAPLRQRILQDKDLDLEIRDKYLNIYYKGNSLLRLAEVRSGFYHPSVDAKFLDGNVLADFTDDQAVANFLAMIPPIKENIIRVCPSSIEAEYEQMIIRANNREMRNAGEYFIVDRQYATGGRDRFDLIGCFWPHNGRRRGQVVAPCILEVKFALNSDIGVVHEQLERYYSAVAPRAAEFAEECETVFRQKLALGLYEQPANRLEAMKTLVFARDIAQCQFVLVLVDYNPNSVKLGLDKLAELPFAAQIRVFRSGFAMWQPDRDWFGGVRRLLPIE
jgi:hypothetical protein